MDFKKRLKNKRRQFEEQLQEFRNSEAEKVASAKEEKVQGGPSKDSSDLLKNKSLGCLTAAEEKLRSKNEQEPPTLKKSFEEEAANHEATQEINNVNGHLKNLKKANAVLEKTKQTPEVENTDLIPEFQNVNPSRQENDDHKKQAGSQLSKIQISLTEEDRAKSVLEKKHKELQLEFEITKKRLVMKYERKMSFLKIKVEAIKENLLKVKRKSKSRFKAYREIMFLAKEIAKSEVQKKKLELLSHYHGLNKVGGKIKVLNHKQNTLQKELDELVNSQVAASKKFDELAKAKQEWENRSTEMKMESEEIKRSILELQCLIECDIQSRKNLLEEKRKELMNTNRVFKAELEVKNALLTKIDHVIKDIIDADYKLKNLKEQNKKAEQMIKNLETIIMKLFEDLHSVERA